MEWQIGSPYCSGTAVTLAWGKTMYALTASWIYPWLELRRAVSHCPGLCKEPCWEVILVPSSSIGFSWMYSINRVWQTEHMGGSKGTDCHLLLSLLGGSNSSQPKYCLEAPARAHPGAKGNTCFLLSSVSAGVTDASQGAATCSYSPVGAQMTNACRN